MLFIWVELKLVTVKITFSCYVVNFVIMENRVKRDDFFLHESIETYLPTTFASHLHTKKMFG